MIGEMPVRESSLAEGGEIEGVQLVKLKVNPDQRGSFTEVFQQHWDPAYKFVQFSFVQSEANVMRGCHLHWNHDEYFCLTSGSASVGLRDERPGSKTQDVWSLYNLYEDDLAALIFPRGLVHGWYFHEKSTHLQGVTESYENYGSYDNHRIYWLDPDLEIPWPSRKVKMTTLAEEAASLREVRATNALVRHEYT